VDSGSSGWLGEIGLIKIGISAVVGQHSRQPRCCRAGWPAGQP
jgi:hypothetical protein